MAKHKVLNFPFAILTVCTALLLPAYSKLLLVDLESDGDGTQLGSPELSHEGRNAMQGELRQSMVLMVPIMIRDSYTILQNS